MNAWLRARALEPVEAITVPYLVWAAIVLHTSPGLRHGASPVARHLTGIAPLWAWQAALAGCAVVITAAFLAGRPAVARAGYVLAGALWLLIVWVLWRSTHSRIVAGPYVFVAVTTLWRSATLAARHG